MVRVFRWLTPAGFIALISVGATLGVAAWQISANRAAANQRAKVERQQLAAQAKAQLRLAAVSVVLGAPSCDSAIARAELASAVLGDKLPSDFVERVASVRAVSFPNLVAAPGWSSSSTSIFQRFSPTTTGLSRAFLALLRKAEHERTVTCKDLSKGR
jgi:hypothetical protein